MRNKLIAVLVAFLVITDAQASSTSSGIIGEIAISSDGTARVNVSGQRTAVPSCQSAGFPQAFGFDTSKPGGPALLSLLLSDRATKRPLIVYGSGLCTSLPNIEDIGALDDSG